jgi:hypothetical protein
MTRLPPSLRLPSSRLPCLSAAVASPPYRAGTTTVMIDLAGLFVAAPAPSIHT